jgi:hypothetical protein
VDKAYSALDAYGFIQPNSRLVQKGDHAGGAASGLSNDAKAIVQEWLAKENQDRGGKTTPSILEKLGPCMSRALFATIRFQDLRTVKRAAEDPNRCTGCTNAMCSSCHGDIATPFYTQVGSALGDNTFEMSKKMPYITKYFGVNGTEPVPSHGIAKKQNAVNSTLLTGSHPNFYLLPQVTLAINNFVNDAIAKYKAGTCGNSSL